MNHVIKSVIKRLLAAVKYPLRCISARRMGLRWDSSWVWHGLPIVTQWKKNSIEIGTGWLACSRPEKNSIGVMQPVILRTKSTDAWIRVGRDVGMSGCSIVARESIIIEDEVLIGSGVLIIDNDAHPLLLEHRNDSTKISSRPIVIRKGAFIGARAIITKGVEIGEGAVVGAGAVVSKSVRPFAIVAGNPATIVGENR